LIVYQRFLSISSVLGGKNSKEIAGCLVARGTPGATGIASLMTLNYLRGEPHASHGAKSGNSKIGEKA
jgi:hypothetical protein